MSLENKTDCEELIKRALTSRRPDAIINLDELKKSLGHQRLTRIINVLDKLGIKRIKLVGNDIEENAIWLEDYNKLMGLGFLTTGHRGSFNPSLVISYSNKNGMRYTYKIKGLKTENLEEIYTAIANKPDRYNITDERNLRDLEMYFPEL